MGTHPLHGRRHRGTRIAPRPPDCEWTADLVRYMPWSGTLAEDTTPRLEWVANSESRDPCPGWAIMIPRPDDERLCEITGAGNMLTDELTEALAVYLTECRLPVPPLDDGGWVIPPADPRARIDVLEER